MTLREIINLTTSADYENEFLNEYRQLYCRYIKLKRLLDKQDRLGVEIQSLDIYRKQLSAMNDYLRCLQERASLEGIKL